MNSEKFLKQTEYAHDIAHLLNEYDNVTGEVVKAQNYITMSERMRKHDKTLQFKEMLGNFQETQKVVLALLKERTGKIGIAATRDFHGELMNKLEFGGKLRSEFLRAKAGFDFQIKFEQFETAEARAAAEAELTERKNQFDQATEVIAEMIPVVSKIIDTLPAAAPGAVLSLV